MSALLHDPATVRLGRQKHVHDDRDLFMARYVGAELLASVPASVDHSTVVADWRMLLNDKLGDCTIAALLHEEMLNTARAGDPWVATDADALAGYQGACGYRPDDPSTDQGGNERAVLTFARRRGIGDRKIKAFVRVDPTSAVELRTACYLFGAVYLGVDLQEAQQSQEVWDYKPSAEWGGHAVPMVAVDQHGGGKVVTWGAVKGVTASFIRRQCEEAWAVLSTDQLNAHKLSPEGFDLAQLDRDLLALA